MQDITIVTPTIPSRSSMFTRAMRSAHQQTLPPAAISVAIDVNREGAAATRERALMAAKTTWVAFLDDDDALEKQHLEKLMRHAEETNADFVYSWFWVPGGTDPFPETHYTNPFDPEEPIETTITTLVKTELAQSVGFKPLDRGEINGGEDRYFTLECLAAGAKISHLVDRTWYWFHHSGNTSGLPTKGDSLRW